MHRKDLLSEKMDLVSRTDSTHCATLSNHFSRPTRRIVAAYAHGLGMLEPILGLYNYLLEMKFSLDVVAMDEKTHPLPP